MLHGLRPRPKQWSRKTWATLVVLVLIAVLTIYVVHGMHTPAVGTIVKNDQSAPAITDTTDYSSLDTEHFSLLYPSDYSGDFGSPKSGQIDYRYFDIKDGEKVKSSLEIYLVMLPYGGITLSSEYKSYNSDPKTYQPSNKFYHSEAVDIFAKDKDGKERNALWEHGKYILVVKLHTDDPDIDTMFKSILTSVQWK